ncbi:MAG: sulfatase [Planctomycetes bacterium]|nr:sulfatase [Planctomycetota bacterium]
MSPSTRREFLQTSAAVGASAWALASQARALRGGRKQPNVVLLMLDALRPDYTQAYGEARPTSPWMRSFADQAAVFDRCWSSSTWTAPACASLFSGLYPPEHGIVEGFMANSRRKERQEDKGVADRAPTGQKINTFAPDMVLLPQYLREFGYRCFGIATNPNIGPQIGFDRGFEEFQVRPEGTANEVTEWIESWREPLTQGDQPYFLYLHYMDVHKPYNQRAPWYQPSSGGESDPGETRSEAEEAAEAYRSELRFMDEHLAALEKSWGWDKDTLVIVVSDHGEEFGEHGGIGHSFQMHAELNRILLMARGPGVQAGRIATPVGIHDLLPTLLDHLQLAPPVETSGKSLAPLLTGVASEGLEERLLYAHRRKSKFRPLDIWGVNHKRWRMILNEEGQLSMFDIEADPLEQSPVAVQDQPEIHEKLGVALRRFAEAGISDRAVLREVEQSEAERAMLERLGYADGEEEGGE